MERNGKLFLFLSQFMKKEIEEGDIGFIYMDGSGISMGYLIWTLKLHGF